MKVHPLYVKVYWWLVTEISVFIFSDLIYFVKSSF